jgi:hypothetical protein
MKGNKTKWGRSRKPNKKQRAFNNWGWGKYNKVESRSANDWVALLYEKFK